MLSSAVTVFQFLNKFMGADGLGCADNFLIGSGFVAVNISVSPVRRPAAHRSGKNRV